MRSGHSSLCVPLPREVHGTGKGDAGGSIGKEDQAGIAGGCKII